MTDYKFEIHLENGVIRLTTYQHLVEVLAIWDADFNAELFARATPTQALYLGNLLKKYFAHILSVKIYDDAGKEI